MRWAAAMLVLVGCAHTGRLDDGGGAGLYDVSEQLAMAVMTKPGGSSPFSGGSVPSAIIMTTPGGQEALRFPDNGVLRWPDSNTQVTCSSSSCTYVATASVFAGSLSAGTGITVTTGDIQIAGTTLYRTSGSTTGLFFGAGSMTDNSSIVGMNFNGSATANGTLTAAFLARWQNAGATQATLDSTGYIASGTPSYLSLAVGTTALLNNTTLDGMVLPARAFTATAITGRISTAGSGGTTGLVLKISDGTNTCTHTRVCTGTGNVRIASVNGAGSGCVFPANASLTLTCDATSDCATYPVFLNGGTDVEGKWQ